MTRRGRRLLALLLVAALGAIAYGLVELVHDERELRRADRDLSYDERSLYLAGNFDVALRALRRDIGGSARVLELRVAPDLLEVAAVDSRGRPVGREWDAIDRELDAFPIDGSRAARQRLKVAGTDGIPFAELLPATPERLVRAAVRGGARAEAVDLMLLRRAGRARRAGWGVTINGSRPSSLVASVGADSIRRVPVGTAPAETPFLLEDGSA